jgi:catechol 2,3-dioxygenase-like lactoylglutathione lyase family enzyme
VGTIVDRSIAHVTLVVRDYDEAIRYFTGVLKFELVEDLYVPEQDKRWVVVAPRGSAGATLVLGRASSDAQRAAVGRQTGGRVAFFLRTDDFQRDYDDFVAGGVQFVRPPSDEAYGTVAVFEDLYGNLWDLVGPRVHSPP